MLVHYIVRYIEYLEVERGLSGNTLEAYKNDLYSLSSFFQNNGISDDVSLIQRVHLNMYIKNLYDNHYNARSITRKIASIKGFFKWLNINDIIKHNPALAIEQPKLPKRLPKVLSVKEIFDLLNENMSVLDKAVLELLYASGLRVSELSDIQINNINLLILQIEFAVFFNHFILAS